ncbi:MAG: EthD family reductase [Pseudomonadota bacterium]
MTTIIVLFNLQNDEQRADYEHWARTTDLPTVRKLPSVAGFTGLKAVSMLGNDDAPPFQYIEVINVNDMTKFGQDVSTEAMQAVAAAFRGFADNPKFIVCESLY